MMAGGGLFSPEGAIIPNRNRPRHSHPAKPLKLLPWRGEQKAGAPKLPPELRMHRLTQRALASVLVESFPSSAPVRKPPIPPPTSPPASEILLPLRQVLF